MQQEGERAQVSCSESLGDRKVFNGKKKKFLTGYEKDLLNSFYSAAKTHGVRVPLNRVIPRIATGLGKQLGKAALLPETVQTLISAISHSLHFVKCMHCFLSFLCLTKSSL